MKMVLQMALGVMAAAGGFVEIGDIVFASQAGAHFGFGLLWALAVGLVAVIIFSEMVGRISAVTQKPLFVLVRERYGTVVGWITLVASEIVNVMTCAAEVGGVGIVLRMMFGLRSGVLLAIGAFGLIVVAYLLSFEAIENVFGWLGLLLATFLVAAFATGFQWGDAGAGLLVPGHGAGAGPLLYAYFAVGIIAATLMPYEILFYSSGSLEQKWTPKDLKTNALTAGVGYTLGSLLVVGVVGVSMNLFRPLGIEPETLSSAVLGPLQALGRWGLFAALGGMLFTIGGAAIETSFSAAYSAAQFLGWDWGARPGLTGNLRFSAMWIGSILVGAVIMATGVDAVQLTEYAVIFSVVLMPLSYLPIMLTGDDRSVMGEHVNAGWLRVAGWISFGMVCIVALAAIPLMILTRMGSVG